MKLFENIDRVILIHNLICLETTGSPDIFASRINIKKRQLYNILEEFRIRGAVIEYNRHNRSYYYVNEFKVSIQIGVETAKE